MPEQLGRELEATDLVDRSGRRAAEPMRGNVGNTCAVHHVAELSSDVVRRMRSADAGREQQRVRVREPDPLQPLPDCAEREAWKGDSAHRAGRLRVILPMRRLPFLLMMVPQILTAGIGASRSRSPRRIASTSPIRAEVPRSTSTI